MRRHFDDELVLIWSLACGGNVPEATLEFALYRSEVLEHHDIAQLHSTP